MLASAIPFPNISPEIFSVSLGGFEFALRWYALAYIGALLFGWWLARRVVQNVGLWPSGPPVTKEQLDDLLTWVIVGVVLGGRLGYVLFYEPERYAAAPLDIFKVWQGGMAFHGGALGVLVAGLLFSWRHKLRALSLGDIIVLATPMGLLLGRLSNFINAELWGRETDLPWGVIFPGSAAQSCVNSFVGTCARHPTQLYEALLEGAVLGIVLFWFAFRRRAFDRPGLLIGVFLAVYGIARFAIEFVRVADAQFITPENPLGHVIQFGTAGLSMGQLLSLPMVIVGIWMVLAANRLGHVNA